MNQTKLDTDYIIILRTDFNAINKLLEDPAIKAQFEAILKSTGTTERESRRKDGLNGRKDK